MAQANRNNIFTLLEDEEEPQAAPKSKQAQTKTRNEPAKAAPNQSRNTGKEPTNHPKGKKEAPVDKERQSRTGRGTQMKKGGGGQHNWGKPEQVDEVPLEEETQQKKKYRKKPEIEEELKQEEEVPEAEKVITMSEWMGIEQIVEEEVKNDGLLQFRIPRGRGRGRGRRRGEGPRRPQNTRAQPASAPVFTDTDFPALG